MGKYDLIDKGIKENNIDLIKESISSICYADRLNLEKEIHEAINYVEQKGIKIKDQQLVGKLISDGKRTFSEDDFMDAVYEMRQNLCDERIADVKIIVDALYGHLKKENTPLEVNEKKSGGTSPNIKSHQEVKSNKTGMVFLVAILIILIVIITIVLKEK